MPPRRDRMKYSILPLELDGETRAAWQVVQRAIASAFEARDNGPLADVVEPPGLPRLFVALTPEDAERWVDAAYACVAYPGRKRRRTGTTSVSAAKVTTTTKKKKKPLSDTQVMDSSVDKGVDQRRRGPRVRPDGTEDDEEEEDEEEEGEDEGDEVEDVEEEAGGAGRAPKQAKGQREPRNHVGEATALSPTGEKRSPQEHRTTVTNCNRRKNKQREQRQKQTVLSRFTRGQDAQGATDDAWYREHAATLKWISLQEHRPQDPQKVYTLVEHAVALGSLSARCTLRQIVEDWRSSSGLRGSSQVTLPEPKR